MKKIFYILFVVLFMGSAHAQNHTCMVNLHGIFAQRELSILIDEIEEECGGKAVTLDIHSRGGDIVDSFAVLDELIERKVNTHARHLVASSAVLVFLTGEVREADPEAIFLLHSEAQELNGAFTVKQLKEILEGLEIFRAKYIAFVSSRTGMSKKQVINLMDAGEYLPAQKAVELGIVTKLSPTT